MSAYRFKSFLGNTIIARDDGAFIPCDQANIDCAQFLADWKAGATVLNEDDSPASYNEATVEALGLEPL
jgi:hypothetical protein